AAAVLEPGLALVFGFLRKEEALQGLVELGETRLERRQLAARELAQLGVLLAQERAVLRDVAPDALALAPRDDRLLELRPLLGELRELAPVGDDRRVGDE